MSQDSVEIVRRLFAHWERGDWPASAEHFDPDFETVFGTDSFPDPGHYRGARRTLDAWREWLEAWDELRVELQEVIDAGERVVTLQRLRGRGKGSGADVDREVGSIFDFDQGRIVRMVFCDRDQALEAAGLRE